MAEIQSLQIAEIRDPRAIKPPHPMPDRFRIIAPTRYGPRDLIMAQIQIHDAGKSLADAHRYLPA